MNSRVGLLWTHCTPDREGEGWEGREGEGEGGKEGGTGRERDMQGGGGR